MYDRLAIGLWLPLLLPHKIDKVSQVETITFFLSGATDGVTWGQRFKSSPGRHSSPKIYPGNRSGPHGVEDSDGPGMLREHVGQPRVSHRAFVQIGAHHHHASRSEPVVHFDALKASLGLHPLEQTPRAMNGRIERFRAFLSRYAFEDHGVIAHAPADEASLTRKGRRCAFPHDPEPFAVVLLGPCEVVVIVDALDHFAANDLASAFDNPFATGIRGGLVQNRLDPNTFCVSIL